MTKRNDLPIRPEHDQRPAGQVSNRAEIAAFLAEARNADRPAPATGRGRLVFALDATMSRQPTWDLACNLQAGLFDASSRVGGLDVQLVYFRGHGEARASRWVQDAAALTRVMAGIACRGGLTQIGKVLDSCGKGGVRSSAGGHCLRRRRHGRGHRPGLPQGGSARAAQHPRLHVSRRLRSDRRSRLSRDRPAHGRRLPAVRSQRRRRAARAARSDRRLCRRRSACT